MHEIASAVGAVPWGDWPAVAQWYSRFYSSSGQPRSRGVTPLPEWLKAKLQVSVNPAGEVVAIDPLKENDLALERVAALARENPDNLEIQRQYRDALDGHSATRKRILQTAGEYVRREDVEAILARIHARIPDAIERDLAALLPEARKCVHSVDEWSDFCARAMQSIRQRMVESKFA